jgi:hypothetical protein
MSVFASKYVPEPEVPPEPEVIKYFPGLSHFRNENPWVASAGRLRFRIMPTVTHHSDDDEEIEGYLTSQVWEGPWALEFSQVEEEKVFPMTREGLEAIPPYLEEWRKIMAARPPHSLEENIARRQEPAS